MIQGMDEILATTSASPSQPETSPVTSVSSSAAAVPRSSFSHSIKQQIEPVIKAHKLHRLVCNPSIAPRFLNEENQESDQVNEAYSNWKTQYQFLLTWLQLSLSTPIPTLMIGCVHHFILMSYGTRFIRSFKIRLKLNQQWLENT